MADDKRSTDGSSRNEGLRRRSLPRCLAIGSWTAKGTPEKTSRSCPLRRAIRCACNWQARSTSGLRKTDGSGAVFLMNLTDPAEAHALLEKLPLGQAGHDDVRTHTDGAALAAGPPAARTAEIAAARLATRCHSRSSASGRKGRRVLKQQSQRNHTALVPTSAPFPPSAKLGMRSPHPTLSLRERGRTYTALRASSAPAASAASLA